jgi:hypothetical protein
MKLESLKSFLIILAIAGLVIILKKNIIEQKEIKKAKTSTLIKTFIETKPQINTQNSLASKIILKPQEQLLDITVKKSIPGNEIRFNLKTGRCENDQGEESASENPYSECSDLSNRNLENVPFGTFVIYGNNLRNSDMSKNNIDIYALLFGEVKFDRATIFPESYGDIKNALIETNFHIIDDISIASITLYEQKNILLKQFRELKSQYLNAQANPEKLQELTMQMQKIKTEMSLCDDKIRTNSYKESRHKKFNRKIEEEL